MQFSPSKKEVDKIEEATRYEMEVKRLENINEVLLQTIDKINVKEDKIRELSKDYNITEKDDRTYVEIENSVNENSKLYEKKKQELNLISDKITIQEELYSARDDFTSIHDLLLMPMIGVIISMMYYNFPSLFNNVDFNALRLIIPSVIGYLGTAGYCIKRTSNYKQVFKKLNLELGSEALKEKILDISDEQFDMELEKLIGDACTIKLQLESDKRKLESLKGENNSQKFQKENNSLNTSLQISETYEEPYQELDEEKGLILKKIKK